MPEIPTFKTKRLILKGISEKDIPAYEKHFVNYEVIRHLTNAPWPYPEGGVEDFIKNNILPSQGKDLWSWGIYLKEKPEDLIGAVELRLKSDNRGLWLGEEFWGQGLMSEAIVPITDYAFDGIGFEKLVFTNATSNRKSSRIKVKSGARLVRTEPAKFVDPSYDMQEVWELTREDWKSREH